MRVTWPISLPLSSAAVMLLACLAPTGASAVERTRARELISLLIQDCGSCHGMTLRGGLGKPLTAAALAPRDANAIAAIILDGVAGTPMPPWRGLLTQEDALWIAGTLKKGLAE